MSISRSSLCRGFLAALSISIGHLASVMAEEPRQALPVRGFVNRSAELQEGELAERVAVDVRVLSATDPVDPTNTEHSLPMVVDSRIKDLTAQLEPLHYRTFKLQYEERVILSLLRREKVLLKDGHELTLRPIYLDKGRVGIWFRWNDHQGNKVLDSRVHLTCGESIVAGTEAESGDQGMIIALTAHPSK